jgi:tetratricopeptide (TPR) repeat protein
MNPLCAMDLFRLRAAEGWIELGNPGEALEELDKISLEGGRSAEVQNRRWEVCAVATRWEDALVAANALIFWAVEDPLGWLHRAFALHKLGMTESARDCLLGAQWEFPGNPKIQYDLAVYQCQLGRPLQALSCLQKAFIDSDAKKMTIAALADPNLQPLWRSLVSPQPLASAETEDTP